MGSPRVSTHVKRTVGALVAGALLSTPLAAVAADGGAGSSGGGTGTGGAGLITWIYKDSYGAPTYENAVAAMNSVNVKVATNTADAQKTINEALTNANNECQARARQSGDANPSCRLVSLGFVHTPNGGGTTTDNYTGSTGGFTAKQWQDAFGASGIASNTYYYQGKGYQTGLPFSDGVTSVNSLVARETASAPHSVIAIVLNQNEPPVAYDLTVGTRATGTTTKAGDTNAVSDTVVTGRSGSTIAENVSGTITLHWRGVDGTTGQASKRFSMGNSASSVQSFSYTDVYKDWRSWPAGSYWFDVHFDKQGRMKQAVDHLGSTDTAEQWKAPTTPNPVKTLTNAAGEQVGTDRQVASGSLYTAHIKAHSNASQHFWLYDTIDVSTQNVRIGATDSDDLSKVTVTDETGKTVAAQISVDDSQPGKRVVKAHLTTPPSGWFTLNVPQSATPTGTDYTIKDDSKACWTGDGQGCQSGNSEQVGKVTPKPDKVWVLNEQGALVAEDPTGTNTTGSDTKTFVTGDPIGAVVNGTIPAHLLNPFTSYSITDDWSASAKWIDWDHKDQVRVYVDGQDVTSQFTISVDTAKHTTTATASTGFLAKTALGTKDRKVKLYIGGVVRLAPDASWAADERRTTNKASETWNNETRPTNEPPVLVRNPKPDKVWAADAGQAAQAADPLWTNTVDADTHTFVQGDDLAVTVNGTLPKNLAKDLDQYTLGDDFSKSSPNLDLSQASVKVTIDGKDSTSLFQVHKEGSRIWVTGKDTLLKGSAGRSVDRKVRMTVTGVLTKGVLKAGEKQTLTNGCFEQWNGQSVTGNTPSVREWSPNPDKSWVLMDSDGSWHTVTDPDETNTTGGDKHTFLDGDRVASAVNGTIADDLLKVTRISLTDDWTNADYLWDPDADLNGVRVYEQTATTDAKTSIDRIDRTGTDVTGQFTITRTGNKITATANKDYLAAQVGLKAPKQLTLLIPGHINYANGGGAAQVRQDFGKQAGDELTFCDNPQSSTGKGKLTNAGSESVNNETQKTNEPYICGYVPPVKKTVIAEGSQGGANQDVDGKTVYPGQKVEYRLTTTPELPASLAYSIVTVSDTDTYDQYLLPDEQTLEVTDLSTGRQMTVGDPQMNVPGDYAVTWDKDNHRFTVTYSSDYVKEHWKAGSNPRVQIRFEGTVSKTAPKTVKVGNQWELTLNNMVTPSNRVENTPPSHTPDKKDTQSAKQGSQSVSIDGKTMLLGDTGDYTVTLDLKQKDNAYKVWRAGITDDYDERYVTIDPQDITVLSDTGKDVTNQFNIQVKDGVAYVYARRVDTWITKRGVTVKGDPQPTDLKEYSSADAYDPLNDPAIDQTLLGHTYRVVMPYTVARVESGVVVENTAIQVTNDTSDKTNTVTNPLTPINPTKDVTVKVGGPSVNGKSVYLDSTFLYQLDSSILPANRAYPEVTAWKASDRLDTLHDRYTGQWAVYATRDLYKDGVQIASKGDRIAVNGKATGLKGVDGDLFTADYTDGVFTVTATPTYLALVSRDTAHEAGWRTYIQSKRIATGQRIENTFTETVGDRVLESNTVWTRTPDLTPGLHIEKYDEASGPTAGDRDDVKDALEMKGDSQRIAFKITNTSRDDQGAGAWYRARDLKLDDRTIAGEGTVTDITYPAGWDTLVLKPGQSVIVTGTLKGVSEGGKHTDRVKVTGTPLVTCPVQEDQPFAGNTGSGITGDGTTDSDGRTDAADGTTGTTGDSDGQTGTADTSDTTTQALERVTVDGTERCADTQVTSNTDDWSGYRTPRLAQTGTTVLGVLALTLTIGPAGFALAMLRRRHAGTGHATTTTA